MLLGLLGAFVMAAMALLAGTASAAEVFVRTASIGAAGSGNGELSLGEHSGVVVNQATGNLYVADTGNGRVEEFGADGTFVRVFGSLASPTFIAIDDTAGPSAGDLYVADSDGSVNKFEADGTEVAGWTLGAAGTFGEIKGIAVGPTGDLFVLNEESTVDRFDEAGGALGTFESPRGSAPLGLAADPEGNLYKAAATPEIVKFTDAGESLGEPDTSATALALAIDPASGDLFVPQISNSQARVSRFELNCGQGCNPLEVFGPRELVQPSGIAIGPDGTSYVADAGSSTVAVFTRQIVEAPTVSTGPATAITGNGAQLGGDVNPNGAVTTCEFQVISKAEFKIQGFGGANGFPCSTAPGSGSSEVAVEAEALGLKPGTEYVFRLSAANAGGTVFDGTEPPREFTTDAVAPTIDGQSTIDVGLSDATLAATIQPGGAPTTYHFDYVEEAAFLAEGFAGAATRSTPEEGPISGDNAEHAIFVAISELSPNTAYRFRVVATNVAATVSGSEPAPAFRTQTPALLPAGGCPNEAFRSGFGALLPDCRAFEQATPVDKGGLYIEGFPDFLAAAPDGSAVTYMSGAGSGFPAGGGGRQDTTGLLASLSGGTWSTQRLLPPESFGEKASLVGMSRDLRFAVVAAGTLAETALFLIDTSDGSITRIAPDQNELGLNAGPFKYDAMNSDGTRVLFESEAQLTANATPGRGNLYLWNHGVLSLAGVLPEGEGGGAPSGGSFGGAYAWYSENLAEGGSNGDLYVEAIHAASSDVAQIYFTAGDTGQIYLRSGLAGPAPRSVRISKANEGVQDPFVEAEGLEGRVPAAFQEATPDGSRAFFISSQKLTEGASTGEFDQGKDLYRYDRNEERLVDITADLETPQNPNGAEVQGLLGVSEDGSSGYFAARGAFSTGATAGEFNIYRFVETGESEFTLTFVFSTPEGVICNEESGARNWSPSSLCDRLGGGGGYFGKAARVTPDGQELVFTKSGNIYRYSAAGDEVACVSCITTGATSKGPAELTAKFFNGVTSVVLPATYPSSLITHNLADDGDRVFFQTPNSLTSEDTNGPPNCRYLAAATNGDPTCMDVYEWEAPGTPGGSCQKAEVNGGCLYLLSEGKSDEASYFVDASSDGKTAFIATTSKLVPTDHDELYDVYAVRVDGGLASQNEAPPTPCTSAEGCNGASATPAPIGSSGTSAFQGTGNLHLRRCKKGTVRKRGKCVKKPHRRAHSGAKHKKKGERQNHGRSRGHDHKRHVQGGSKTGDGK